MKEIIFDLLSVGKPAKAFSLNPEVKKAVTDIQSCWCGSTVYRLGMLQEKTFQFLLN